MYLYVLATFMMGLKWKTETIKIVLGKLLFSFFFVHNLFNVKLFLDYGRTGRTFKKCAFLNQKRSINERNVITTPFILAGPHAINDTHWNEKITCRLHLKNQLYDPSSKKMRMWTAKKSLLILYFHSNKHFVFYPHLFRTKMSNLIISLNTWIQLFRHFIWQENQWAKIHTFLLCLWWLTMSYHT